MYQEDGGKRTKLLYFSIPVLVVNEQPSEDTLELVMRENIWEIGKGTDHFRIRNSSLAMERFEVFDFLSCRR